MTGLGEHETARFWAKVEKGDGCWLWTGSTSNLGYGDVVIRGRYFKVHRVSYELLVGPIPEGLTIDHLCRVRNCVNPAHLEPVTQHVNLLRGTCPAAINARKTHCIRGHEFDDENTYWETPTKRKCRACRAVRYAERRQQAAA